MNNNLTAQDLFAWPRAEPQHVLLGRAEAEGVAEV